MIRLIIVVLAALALPLGVILLNDAGNFALENAAKIQGRVYLGDDENGNEIFVSLKDVKK